MKAQLTRAHSSSLSSLASSSTSARPDARLADAIRLFETDLPPDQKAIFKAHQDMSAESPPDIQNVMQLTAEIDRRMSSTSKGGQRRCFGTRLVNVLEAVQRFAALGDIVVGGSQNLVACGVWALVRMTLMVGLLLPHLYSCSSADTRGECLIVLHQHVFMVRSDLTTLHGCRPLCSPLRGHGRPIPSVPQVAAVPFRVFSGPCSHVP